MTEPLVLAAACELTTTSFTTATLANTLSGQLAPYVNLGWLMAPERWGVITSRSSCKEKVRRVKGQEISDGSAELR